MSFMLSPSRLLPKLLTSSSLAGHHRHSPSFLVSRLVSTVTVSDLGFRGHLPGDLVRSREWIKGTYEMLMIPRGLETLLAGVALVLILANFHSPGTTNLFFRVPHPPRAAVPRAYSMETSDAGPSIVVYVTVPNKEAGTKLAHGIIENRLAACVNQIPGVESTYWWEGKVETDTEILLMIKTRQSLLGELTDHVKNNHPYDTPEVIALPITGGSEKYLKWIGDNTKNAEVV